MDGTIPNVPAARRPTSADEIIYIGEGANTYVGHPDYKAPTPASHPDPIWRDTWFHKNE